MAEMGTKLVSLVKPGVSSLSPLKSVGTSTVYDNKMDRFSRIEKCITGKKPYCKESSAA